VMGQLFFPSEVYVGNSDIILGLDSGTSVVKAVAFDLEGTQAGVRLRA
jgi:hypothetical protein